MKLKSFDANVVDPNVANVIEVPVACRYLPPGERVSHLNPLLDTLRGFGMHGQLLARAMLPVLATVQK